MAHYPIPPALKRWLVPIWNSAHQFGWLTYDYLNALGHGRMQRCTVCGHFALLLYRRRVIPPRLEELWGLSPQLASALARKESGDCSRCGAKLRGRRLAQVLLSLYPVGRPPAPTRSLALWIDQPETQSLRVAEINKIDGLHEVLVRLPQFSWSDHHPGSKPGSIVGGVRCEDLTSLTYADASFDLVLTAETLEHVPNLDAALNEIRRVLVPGGRHIFTIPLLPGVDESFARSIVRPDGSIEDLAPRICHPGGDVGYTVFTEFGANLPVVFERAGFELKVFFGPNRAQDLAQVYVCRRRPD
jgi:SAM-dependent methyltransferase